MSDKSIKKLIRAVIFDFGGVLVRTIDPAGRREWEARLGIATGELERVVHGSTYWMQAQKGTLTHDAYWQAVAETLGIPPVDIPKLQQDYFRGDQLDPELVRLIHSLRAAGYKTGLLSNDSARLELKLRDELAIYELFDAVIISANIGLMKPDPSAYHAMTEALSVAPEHCVFIDDMRANVEGAEAFGMHAIHYRAGMDLQAALSALFGAF